MNGLVVSTGKSEKDRFATFVRRNSKNWSVMFLWTSIVNGPGVFKKFKAVKCRPLEIQDLVGPPVDSACVGRYNLTRQTFGGIRARIQAGFLVSLLILRIRLICYDTINA